MQSKVLDAKITSELNDMANAIKKRNELIKNAIDNKMFNVPINYKKEDVPQDYLKLVDAISDMVEKHFKHCDFAVLNWVDEVPKLNTDTWKMELKPIYRVHIKKGNYLILSIFYDIHEIGSLIMPGPYYEIYPVPEETILRFLPIEFNEMIAIIRPIIKENYKEYINRCKVIELKEYFDNKSLDKRIRGRR